ncbi:hypothetical protein CAEBREN_23866 [Caenorhabditis brenneri]|uniref:Uncharacterized protein n=1 Tax=Caenorhabditis brenneri TaxID=135651 RepID=G0MW99_CAEBE|nr:hypothetical protein CAEBREN_23866 [Caenorhabditis brenneri]
MLPKNTVQQYDEAPVTRPRILQLYSRTIEFDLKSQLKKHNRDEESGKYNEEHNVGYGVRNQNAPTLLPSHQSTGGYGSVNNSNNEHQQESYRGFRQTWDPRRQTVASAPMDSMMFQTSNDPSSTTYPAQYSQFNGANLPAEDYPPRTGYQNIAQGSPQFYPAFQSPPMLVYPTIFYPELAWLWVQQYPAFFIQALVNLRMIYLLPQTQNNSENGPPQQGDTQHVPAEVSPKDCNEETEPTASNSEGDSQTDSLPSEAETTTEHAVDCESISREENSSTGYEDQTPREGTSTSNLKDEPEPEDFDLAVIGKRLNENLEMAATSEENSSIGYEDQFSTEGTSTSYLNDEPEPKYLERAVIGDRHNGNSEMAATSDELQKNNSRLDLERSARKEESRQKKEALENQPINKRTTGKSTFSSSKKTAGSSKSVKKQKCFATETADENQASTTQISEKFSKQSKSTSKNANSLESSSNTESDGIRVESNKKPRKSKRSTSKKNERKMKRLTVEKPHQKAGSFGTKYSKVDNGKNEKGESKNKEGESEGTSGINIENCSPESERIQPLAPKPGELLRKPIPNEKQFLVEKVVAENIPEDIEENAKAEQRLAKRAKWILSASSEFSNKPLDSSVALSLLIYSDAMISLRIPHAIWHSKYTANDHLAFDKTGLLSDIMAYTTNNPLIFTSDPKCIERCVEFLKTRVKVYENSNDEDGRRLYVFFKTILDFKQKHFFMQDLMYLSSLVVDDEKKLENDEKYFKMFDDSLNFHLSRMDERYFPTHPGYGLSILVDEILGPRFLSYIDTQYKLRIKYVSGKEEEQRMEDSLTLRQKKMLEQFRKTDLSKGKWTARDAEKYLVLLLISALNLPESTESKLIVRLYRFLLLIQSTVINLDIFLYSKVFRILPFNLKIATHKFILNPWFNI